MSPAVFSPNLTKEVQWEVPQIVDKKFPCATVQGGLSVNLNHLKIVQCEGALRRSTLSASDNLMLKLNECSWEKLGSNLQGL